VDEWGSYVVAFVLLVVLGAWLRTPILNWICGPAFVVLVVVGIGRLRDRAKDDR
jgi:hypothetical protein